MIKVSKPSKPHPPGVNGEKWPSRISVYHIPVSSQSEEPNPLLCSENLFSSPSLSLLALKTSTLQLSPPLPKRKTTRLSLFNNIIPIPNPIQFNDSYFTIV